MDINAIQSAIRDAGAALDAAGHAAWTYVQEREPDLAKAILELGWSDTEAGHWLATRDDSSQMAPIALVAMGRTAELIDAIRRTQHGIF